MGRHWTFVARGTNALLPPEGQGSAGMRRDRSAAVRCTASRAGNSARSFFRSAGNGFCDKLQGRQGEAFSFGGWPPKGVHFQIIVRRIGLAHRNRFDFREPQIFIFELDVRRSIEPFFDDRQTAALASPDAKQYELEPFDGSKERRAGHYR